MSSHFAESVCCKSSLDHLCRLSYHLQIVKVWLLSNLYPFEFLLLFYSSSWNFKYNIEEIWREWTTLFCLIPDFRGISLGFPHLLWCWLLFYCMLLLLMFRYIPLDTDLSKTFIMKRCWILSKAFLAFSGRKVWLSFFSLFIVWITLIDYRMLTHPNMPG